MRWRVALGRMLAVSVGATLAASAGFCEEPPQAGKKTERRGSAAKSAAPERESEGMTEGVYIEILSGGGYEVTWPDGCVARYDGRGKPSSYTPPCDEAKAAESQQIVDSYRR